MKKDKGSKVIDYSKPMTGIIVWSCLNTALVKWHDASISTINLSWDNIEIVRVEKST